MIQISKCREARCTSALVVLAAALAWPRVGMPASGPNDRRDAAAVEAHRSSVPLNAVSSPQTRGTPRATAGMDESSGSSGSRLGSFRLRAVENYGKLPLSFEANQGQTDRSVKFLSRGNGFNLYLTRDEAVFALPVESEEKERKDRGFATPAHARAGGNGAGIDAVGMRIVEANSGSQALGESLLPGKVNYFIGNDPGKWLRSIPTYGRVRYADIYPGVDLLYYGNQRQLESDFVVAAGADPALIQLQLDGGQHMRISRQGDLILKTAGGELRLERPIAYQEIAGRRRRVAARYVRHGNRIVSFSLGNYDRKIPLVIDPVLAYSTAVQGTNFSAGSGGGHDIAVDSSGNAYITGEVESNVFYPTTGAYTNANQYLFVAKLNSTGSAVDYVSMFGSSNASDDVYGIAVDANGDAVITGFTAGTDFPTQNAFESSLPSGENHAFVTELNPAGSELIYSTYLGGNGPTGTGSGEDEGYGITTDASGAIYVTGITNSEDFPTQNAIQPQCPDFTANGYCGLEGFVTKLDPTQSGAASLVYSTFLGGNGQALGQGIAVDSSGDAYVVGTTVATDFPVTPGAYLTKLATSVASTDAFVSVLNPSGNGFIYSTYVGIGFGWGIAVDSQGDAYITGMSEAFWGNYPTTPGAFQTTFQGSSTTEHAFVTKLNPSGSALVYSSYLGGSYFENSDNGSIAVDSQGDAYVTGYSESSDFPVTANALQSTNAQGNMVAFLTEFNPSGSQLIYSTYLGGEGPAQSFGVALDQEGGIYVTGYTESPNFPTTAGAYQSVDPENTNLFVTKFVAASGTADLALTKAAAPNPVNADANLTYTLTVTNNGPDSATNVLINDPLPAGVSFVSATPTQGNCTSPAASATGAITCNLGTVASGANATVILVVIPANAGTLANTASVALDQVDPDPANNVATATVTVNPACSAITVSPSGALPSATVGVSYSEPFTATGGTGALSWSISSPPPGLTLDPVAGILSGTPSTANNYSFSVTAADQNGCTGTSGVSLTVAAPVPPPVEITDTESISVSDSESFPDVFDSEAVHVTDGVFVTPVIAVAAPVAFFSDASLGFNGQSSSQTITVSNIGESTLNLDSVANAGSAQFSIAQISCSTGAGSFSAALPSGGACILTIGYTTSTTPANDSATLTFTDNAALSNLATVASGSNDTQSIILNGEEASIAGPAAPPATIPVPPDNESITVADSVTVTASLFITTASPLPPGMVGGSYSQTLSAAGGSGSGYTWQVTSGTALTAVGLTLSPAGVISGTPTGTEAAAGFTVQVTDSQNNVFTKTFQLTIYPLLSISPATLPAGAAESGYSLTLKASGGSGSGYSWSIASGGSSLTALGLSLSSTTGTISGTPSAGQASFTVQLTDSANDGATMSYQLTINKATATVTLGNLTQTYTGSPLTVGVTTEPVGLEVDCTYNGKSAAPTSAGTYPVVCTVDDPNYQGSATATLTINNPVPVISSTSPVYASAGSAFAITVNGSGFTPASTVYWGATALTTTPPTGLDTQITAQVPASAIAASGTATVNVQTLAPGGGTSNTWQFEVSPSGNGTGNAPTITPVTASVTPGSSATYSVTLPSGATDITVTCLNLPGGAACSYAGGVLTITTSASTPVGTYTIVAVFMYTVPGAASSALILLPLLLLPLIFARRRWATARILLIACLGIALLTLTNLGCGAGPTHQATSTGEVILIVQ